MLAGFQLVHEAVAGCQHFSYVAVEGAEELVCRVVRGLLSLPLEPPFEGVRVDPVAGQALGDLGGLDVPVGCQHFQNRVYHQVVGCFIEFLGEVGLLTETSFEPSAESRAVRDVDEPVLGVLYLRLCFGPRHHEGTWLELFSLNEGPWFKQRSIAAVLQAPLEVVVQVAGLDAQRLAHPVEEFASDREPFGGWERSK